MGGEGEEGKVLGCEGGGVAWGGHSGCLFLDWPGLVSNEKQKQNRKRWSEVE